MNTWIEDANGNKCSVEYFGSREAAQAALDSLIDCKNCTNCSDCSRCSRCSGCSGCSDCSDCSRCSDCSYVAYQYDKVGVRAQALTEGEQPAFKAPTVPVIPDIHQRVYEAISQPAALDMGTWHDAAYSRGECGTTHCRAGWVVALAGAEGRELEKFFNTELAAMKIYAASGFQINPCRFYDGNEVAREDMRKLAEGEGA